MLVFWFLALWSSKSTSSKGTIVSKGSIRKYILLTLSHVECTAERRDLTVNLIIGRLTLLFVKVSLLAKRIILHLVFTTI